MVREAHDLKGAASVLEAAGCTVQRHRLEEGVWDESGGLYVLPVWVVSDPSDVIEGEDVTMGDVHGDADGDVTEAEEEGADGDGEGDFEGKEGAREGGVLTEKMMGDEEGQKGKGKQVVAAPRDPVKVRARLSDRGTDVVVLVDKDENVKVVVQRILEEAGVSSSLVLVCGCILWRKTDKRCYDRSQQIQESDLHIWARCCRKQPLLPRRVGSLDTSSMPWSSDDLSSSHYLADCKILSGTLSLKSSVNVLPRLHHRYDGQNKQTGHSAAMIRQDPPPKSDLNWHIDNESASIDGPSLCLR